MIKLLDILKEKIDEYDVVNKQNLNELRQSFLDYLKQQLPNTPDYVIQDWIYKMLKQSDNVNTAENIQDWIDNHLKNLKWEYKTNFPMTIDIFNDRTQKELKSRIEGEVRQDVNKDAERHKTQQKLLKSQGISKEPIILMKTKDGKYALGEGWHRTTQSFKMYPEGFTQPSVYIGVGWVDDNKDEVDEYDVENEQDLKEFVTFIKEYKQVLSEGCDCLTEAEYRGRKVQLGKIMQGDIKKFKVYVKNNKGKVVKVNFGFGGKSAKGKRMVIKAKNPKRRAAYRARHNCDNPGPRWKANYWSCKKW